MRKIFLRGILVVAAAAAVLLPAGCSKKDLNNETIASVNGDVIKVRELREFLGVRGSAGTAAEIPVARKKEALDRLVAGRLLAIEARSRGLDNTGEFRNFIEQNRQGVLINALFRREIATKLDVSKDDVKGEARKLMGANKALSEDNATIQARRTASEAKLRKIEEGLIASAKKEFPVVIKTAETERIGKGEKVADNAALATVGSETITYGAVKALLARMSGGTHGSQDLSTNLVAVGRMLDREATGRALAAFARKQGIEGSEWLTAARGEMERSVLIDMLAEKEILQKIKVTDKEIADAYAEHGRMFVQDGKKIPLSAVKDKLREYLRNIRQKEVLDSYIAGLKAKARITVKEELLPNV